MGDYFINHEVRILSLNNQDSMESKKDEIRGSNEGHPPSQMFEWLSG